MALTKLLVIGVTGLVGSHVARLARVHGFDAYGTFNARSSNAPRSSKLDVTDKKATGEFLRKIRPKVVIDTSALHNVDYCETHQEEATRVNVEGTRNLAEACSELNSRFVFVSTDYVFDGTQGPYSEQDRPNPTHHYARTKLEAESVASEVSSHAVARPSVIYGWNPVESTGIPSSSGKTVNFAMFTIDKLSKGEHVRAVDDQYSSPTLGDNLAEALLRLATYGENGVFHTAGRSCVSRYDFALKIAEAFGYRQDLVKPVKAQELKQLAPRPRNSCLRVDKAEKALGMKFLTVDEGLRVMWETKQEQLASVSGI